MKKFCLALAAVCLIALLLGGCGQQERGMGREAAPDRGGSLPAAPDGSPSDEPPDFYASTSLPDAPLYRGTVREISRINGVLQLRLESHPDTDFGYPAIIMQTDGETEADFDLETLVVGDYLQAFYSDRNNGLPPVILSASRLPPADVILYSGLLTAHSPGKDGSGLLELKALDGDQTTAFRYDKTTQFYLDDQALLPGIRLNLLHKGVFDPGNPPQGQALEVRIFAGR